MSEVATRIVEDLKAFWDHYDEHREEFIRNFSDVVGQKIDELMMPHQRELYGFSTAGGCIRANYLRKQYPEHQDLRYWDYHTFFLGHLIEVTAIASLKALGYDVRDMQKEVCIPPYMRSQIDGIITVNDQDYVLSIKSTSYKASTFSKGKNVRKGFAALPFEGILGNPTHYAQIQLEMYALGVPRGIYLVVAKDVIKAYRDDQWMQSLVWYAEEVPLSRWWVEDILLPPLHEAYASGNLPSEALYMVPGDSKGKLPRWVLLSTAEPNEGGENKRLVGFNPCSYCDVFDICSSLT
ncbi:MAG: hypothetical protein QXF26_09770 [Candidatus Bathyarchaeia archaeon]